MSIYQKRALLLVLLFLLIGLGILHYQTSKDHKKESPNENKTPATNQSKEVDVWLTTGDEKNLLAKQDSVSFSNTEKADIKTITIDADTTYQTMDGFGAAITGSSAYLIQNKLDEDARNALLEDLFSRNGVKMNALRHSIGSSDFSVDENGNSSSYTYNDTNGEPDYELEHFSIEKDQAVMTTLQDILAENEDIFLMGTPWTAPPWMKYGEKIHNGWYLDYTQEEVYKAYAQYFVQYIQAFKEKGITIDSMTVQNEPLFTSPNYPTMSMGAEEQARFIGKYLGPALESNEIDTKIIGYDHNWQEANDYVSALFQDEESNKFIDGTAYHCYEGSPDAMAQVQANYPEKNIYFTECSGGEWSEDFADNFSWQMSNLIIGAPRNWAKTVMMWNLALDENGGPTNGGCDNCRGVVTINQSTGEVTQNVEYYALGHASKFVEAGAVRLASTNYPGEVESVAFQNKDGSTVLIALNPSEEEQRFQVSDRGEFLDYVLPGKSAVSFVWE